ncbi:hypothetical protein QOZ80_2AG0135560 [Eleusine coracana subsp. coracana]|nr:hypothetical protein QOZ80_2AG0135560 [Eleusine coracana subsp. coracana]
MSQDGLRPASAGAVQKWRCEQGRIIVDRGQTNQHDARVGQRSQDGGGQPTTGAAVTIGEALQAVALSPAGDRLVDHADAAAVRAAESRATGLISEVVPGGVAAAAQRAAEANTEARERGDGEEEKKATLLRDVLGNATAVMPANKVATWEDAMAVASASAGREAGVGGMGEVADAVAAAAEMNDGRTLLM